MRKEQQKHANRIILGWLFVIALLFLIPSCNAQTCFGYHGDQNMNVSPVDYVPYSASGNRDKDFQSVMIDLEKLYLLGLRQIRHDEIIRLNFVRVHELNREIKSIEKKYSL